MKTTNLVSYWSINFQQITNAFNQLVDGEGLLHKIVCTGCAKTSDFVLFDHT